MKSLLTLLLASLALPVLAQPMLIPMETEGWYHVTHAEGLTTADAIRLVNREVGLPAGWSWTSMSVQYDETGLRHERLMGWYDGVEVDLARLFLYWKNGALIRVKVFAPKFQGQPVSASVSAATAIQLAQTHVGATAWYWDDPGLEQMRKEITGDPAASYAPDPQLVWADTDFDWATHNYRLAWKMELFAAEPMDNRLVYVDAATGEILKDLSQIQHEGVNGSAMTKYRGQQSIVSDSTGVGQYILRDDSRAAQGIATLNLLNGTALSQAVDFTSTTKDWDLTNANWDEASADVHWGSEAAYDILLSRYGFDSFNGAGGQIRSYVHYGAKNYANAFWNVDHAGYGDDNGNPHVGLDIVGHEITHGVVRNTANLIYIDEGGSLNEGFADIFGNSIEALTDSATASWLVGEDSDASRSMSNPRTIVYGPSSQGHPDTYHGNGWYEGDLDNGGAHGNATVLGHWYYLLAAGGTGTNDNGDSYEVNGIGVQHAFDIAWRTLSVYLTPSAGFADARQASILSAEDLFGLCSDEWQAVVNAWYAVGLGSQPVRDGDLGMIDVQALVSCGPDASAPVVAWLKNYGCAAFPPDSFQVIYSLKNPVTIRQDYLELPNGMAPGEILEVYFSQPLDMSVPGDYRLSAANLTFSDPFQTNNESPVRTITVRQPAQDGVMTLESGLAEDTLALRSGAEATATFSDTSGVQGSRAIRLSGGTGSKYRLVEAFPMWGGPAVDPFDYNEDFGAEVCFCVQESGPVAMRFQRRQTYSAALKEEFKAEFPNLNRDSIMSRQGSILRVLVDGEEVGRYFPTTKNQDDWSQEMIDLWPYSSSAYQVCFQSRTIWSTQKDPAGIGDQVFLDNIELEYPATSLEESILKGRIWIDDLAEQPTMVVELPVASSMTLTILDLSGRVVREESLMAGEGMTRVSLPGHVPAGLYILSVANEQGVRRIRWQKTQ